MRRVGEAYSWKKEEQVHKWKGEDLKKSRAQCGQNKQVQMMSEASRGTRPQVQSNHGKDFGFYQRADFISQQDAIREKFF